jgi:hypothetical protein
MIVRCSRANVNSVPAVPGGESSWPRKHDPKGSGKSYIIKAQ